MNFFNTCFLLILSSVFTPTFAQEKPESATNSSEKKPIKLPPSLLQKVPPSSIAKSNSENPIGLSVPKDPPAYLYSAVARPLCKSYFYFGGQETSSISPEPLVIGCASLVRNGGFWDLADNRAPSGKTRTPVFEQKFPNAINPPISKDGDLACPAGSHLYKHIYFIKPFYELDEDFAIPAIPESVLNYENTFTTVEPRMVTVQDPGVFEPDPSSGRMKKVLPPPREELRSVPITSTLKNKIAAFANIGSKLRVDDQQACMTPFQYAVYREIIGNNTDKFATALFDKNVDEKVKVNCLNEYKKSDPQTTPATERAKQIYQGCLSLNGFPPLPAVAVKPMVTKHLLRD